MLDGILDELMGGGNQQTRADRQSERTTPMPPPSRRTRRSRSRQPAPQDGGFGDIFGDFLEPGGDTSPRQRKQTGSIFDEFLES